MSPIDVGHIELDPETAGAVATVHAWGEAFNHRLLDRLLALSAIDIQLLTPGGTAHGHDAIRRLLHLQSYGVAQHVRAQRYIARATTVIVEAQIELRWVDSGELAETMHVAALFNVRDGQISWFGPQPDLAAAARLAGWPPADVPAWRAPRAQGDADEDADRSPIQISRTPAHRGAAT
jgi:hypothetical protein